MNKKIVFFDGDGTLWYPKKTVRSKKPWWVYFDKDTGTSPMKYLMLDPEAPPLLKYLGENGVKIVILSTVPASEKRPQKILDAKVNHFDIANLIFDHIATVESTEAKGVEMLKILKRQCLGTADALMVGDSYHWDYKSATDVGIDARLIDCPYHESRYNNVKYISHLSELVSILGI